MNTTGWLKGLKVTGGGTGVVSHAGVALIRALADSTGLTAGLSRALASDRLLVHDRGRVLADLACAIADGGEAISDFRVVVQRQPGRSRRVLHRLGGHLTDIIPALTAAASCRRCRRNSGYAA